MSETKTLPTTEWVPQDDRLIVQRLNPEKKSRGGIIIPETAQDKAFKGIVLAVGEGINYMDDGSPVKLNRPRAGDIVLFGKYSGSEIEDPAVSKIDDELVVMRWNDIISINRVDFFGNERKFK